MSKAFRLTNAFERDAVAQVIERGYAVSEVAERLGGSTRSLYIWQVRSSKSARLRGAEPDLATELGRVEKQPARVTEERDIPKWATAYFAREAQWRTRLLRLTGPGFRSAPCAAC